MFRTITIILSGNVATSVLTLLRNLIIARLIPVEDYGIAATFAVVMALVEMVSAFGLQQQVIQSRDDDPRWQSGLQGFQVLRAVISAAILFALARPIANFLGVPEVSWAYQLLALAPILNGLVHLDVHRLTRKMVYLPAAMTTGVPALISLLAVWPLSHVFDDYRIMLWAVLLQFTLMAVISLVMSERAYRMHRDRAVIARALRFGWPLMINGLFLFLVLHGEKMIVGRELGMATLGIFAMGFTLTLTPTLVMAKSVQSFFLPQLSAVQEDDFRFQPLARTTIEVNLLNGLLLVVGVMLLGEVIVRVVLGPDYAALQPLMVWLAILQAMRVFKSGGAVVGLARAKTENAMIANAFRVISLPLSWWVAIETGDLLLVIWIATAGECIGVIASLVLVRYRAGVGIARLWPVFLACALLLGVAALHAGHATLPAPLLSVPRWTFAVTALALLGVVLWTMRDARAYLRARQMQKFET